MKTLIFYECDICRRRYNTKELAEECESRGRPKPFPRGLIYGDHRKNRLYHEITFAIAKNNIDGHWNAPGSWAARDNGAGDNYGKVLCGGNYQEWKDVVSNNLDKGTPTYRRIYQYLVSKKIKPVIWNGTSIIPATEPTQEIHP